jgi:hypothetical protein
MSLITFTEIAGVPVHYDRYEASSGFGYGTRGKPFKPRATRAMIDALDACFAQLFARAPWGAPEVIASAGAYTAKAGHHGLGQAFDLDALFWRDRHLVAIEFPAKPHLYLAVESVVRQHFGTVLNYNYNEAHRDHLHIDLGTAVGFQKYSKSRVEFVQAALLYVHGYEVGVDGVWGPGVAEVAATALRELQIPGAIGQRAAWMAFLEATTVRAFALAQ